MFIVFEGINKAGTTTLSYNFAAHLNKNFLDDEIGLLRLDPHLGDFEWTREPTLPRDEAQRLNSAGYIDEYRREKIFFESRIRHQNDISGKNIVCDHYVWSGITYAEVYSPGCFRLLKELYLTESLFIQPDLYVFVDTPVDECFNRDETLDLDVLRELRAAFERTRAYLRVPVISVRSVGSEEESMKALITAFEEFVSKNDLEARG